MAVPFYRQLKLGKRGKDVEAVQRGLSRAGIRHYKRTGYFGLGTRTQLKKFQKRKGIPQSGVYGERTHKQLRKHFDSYANYLYRAARPKVTIQDKMVAAAMFGWRNHLSIHYTQSSLRMYGVRNKIRIPNIPRYEDCSSYVTWVYWHSGARDPNGLGYNGFGYTGTLARNGRRVSTPQKGDLIFYGSFPHSHVTIYVGNGMCVSHGNEGGPMLLRYNYRPVAQIRRYV